MSIWNRPEVLLALAKHDLAESCTPSASGMHDGGVFVSCHAHQWGFKFAGPFLAAIGNGMGTDAEMDAGCEVLPQMFHVHRDEIEVPMSLRELEDLGYFGGEP